MENQNQNGNLLASSFEEEKFPYIDTKAINLSFSDWLHNFSTIRSQFNESRTISEQTISSEITTVAKAFSKPSISQWITMRTNEIFTWTDYYISYHTLKEMAKTGQATQYPKSQEFLLGICNFYYKSNNLQTLETSFDKFMSHEPYDYSRSHGWHQHPDYISYGEALEACLMQKKSNDAKYRLVLEKFREQFPQFKDATNIEALEIPYEVYSQNWEELRSVKTRKPWNLEFCFYYIVKRNLPTKYLFEEKASATPPTYYLRDKFEMLVFPSLKWCTITDIERIIHCWREFVKICSSAQYPPVVPMLSQAVVKHCNLIKFTLPDQFDFFYHWGIRNRFGVSYRDGMENFFSFFGDALNCCAFATILQCQILSTLQVWKENQQKPQDNLLGFVLEPLISELRRLQRLIKGWTKTESLSLKMSWDSGSEIMQKKYPEYAGMNLATFPSLKEVHENLSSLYEGKIQLEELELDFWRNPKEIQEHIQAFSFSTCSSFASTQQPDEAIAASLCLNEFIKVFPYQLWKKMPTEISAENKAKLQELLKKMQGEGEKREEKSGFDETFEQLVAQDKNIMKDIVGDQTGNWPSLLHKNIAK